MGGIAPAKLHPGSICILINGLAAGKGITFPMTHAIRKFIHCINAERYYGGLWSQIVLKLSVFEWHNAPVFMQLMCPVK